MWLFVSGLSSSHMNARRPVLRVFAKVSTYQPIQKPYIASSLRTPPSARSVCAGKARNTKSMAEAARTLWRKMSGRGYWSVRQKGRGTYSAVYQRVDDNRVRKIAHTIIRKRLTDREISTTGIGPGHSGPRGIGRAFGAAGIRPRGHSAPGIRPWDKKPRQIVRFVSVW